MLRIPEKDWDREYAQGKWEYLATPIERVRHAVIGMYCNQLLNLRAKILDAGCGEGILLDYLRSDLRKNYLGVDLSKEAVKGARAKRDGIFMTADLEGFKTKEKFEAIVFNEVLYHVDEVVVFERYLEFLTEGGYFVISLYKHKYDVPIWKNIKRFYQLIDWVEITGLSKGKKITWRIEVAKKKTPKAVVDKIHKDL